MRKLTIRPYPYQKKAIKAALAGLNGRFRRALVVLATGLGKTLTAALIAKKFKAKRILFLVHSNHILEHAVSEFRLVFAGSGRTGAIYNGLSKNGAASAELVFSTWQTMSRNLKEWVRNHFDLIVVDEAHHSEAETYKPVVEYFTGAKLGITATPDREDEADIRGIFGPEVVEISLEKAIAKGWLPEVEYHVITDESLDEDALQKIMADIKRSKKRFTMAEVDRRIFIQKRDEEIAKIIGGYEEKAVVFCSSIGHAERMSGTLPSSATFHSAKSKSQKKSQAENQKVLRALDSGTIKRVCAVNAFNEGVNVPSVGLVAFCRVTQVVTIFRQQLGRGLRPGKKKLIVLDFVGNLARIKLILEMIDKIKGFGGGGGKKGKRGTRKKFNVSGAGFKFTFSDEVVDLIEVLKHTEREFYPTWQEASGAAKRLGVRTKEEYTLCYREDNRLPGDPSSLYRDFPGWPMFLRDRLKAYSTWQQAATAVRRMGIKVQREYYQRYKENPRLPGSPASKYKDFPGWDIFLRGEKKKLYPTWQKAAAAARKLGIKTGKEYTRRWREDKGLPGFPLGKYKDFPGWDIFLRGEKKKLYPTWQKAAAAARKLGIKTQKEYRDYYQKDPCLPSSPPQKYKNFPGWAMFLRNEEKKQPAYPTWQQASRAARRIKIKGKDDYCVKYKLDPRLRSNPNQVYLDFPGWLVFLGKKKSSTKK